MPKRTTIYLDPKIHQAIKIKSAHSNRSISELISEAIQLTLKEDAIDKKATKDRAKESNVAFKKIAAKLKEPSQPYNVKNQRRRYMIVIEASEEGGYHAWCPSFAGCHSQGDTVEDTKKNIIEAIQCHLESLLKEGKRPPQEPEEFVGSVEVPIAG